ncbi:MAG: multicopper oxidase type [Geobacteraceae bacterium]|nr:MAG: multicopper oxidase type [Geobacteraceae bacterium]
MALPVIARQKLTAREKRDFFKHWFPPNNPNAAALDLVPAVAPIVDDPVAPTTIINDGSPSLNGLPAGTTVRGIQRDLLNGVTLNFPAGTTGTRVPGATSTQMWVLASPSVRTFPSKTVRVVENDVVQAQISGKTGTHTIHWHGIEPMAMSDGVGKQSFELSAFKAQFAVNQAGNYFYHCHKNTVLHFEMGLYGLLIVDPKAPAFPGTPQQVLPPFTDGGRGCCMTAKNTPGFTPRAIDSFTDANFPKGSQFAPHVVDYDAECLWVVDDIDTLWHTFGVNEAMANAFGNPANPADINTFVFTPPAGAGHGQLNDFRPDIFCITGIVQANGGVPEGTIPAIPDDALTPITGPGISATVRVGQTVLVRLLNASYCTSQFTFGLDATCVAMDGRPLGVRAEGKYSKPFVIPAGRPFRLTTARRNDFLIKATKAGTFRFKTEFFTMYRGFKVGRAITTITVVP